MQGNYYRCEGKDSMFSQHNVTFNYFSFIVNDCKVYKEFIQIQKEADLCNYNPVQDPTGNIMKYLHFRSNPLMSL